MAIDLGAQKEEVMKERSNLNKSLTPRVEVCTILGFTCRKNDYRDMDGYDIAMLVEGKDLTSQGFEGFFIDKEDESLGRYKGAVGSVKLSQYTFATKTFPAKGTKPEQTVDRDTAIVTEFGKIAKLVGKVDELFEGEVADIPSLIAKASTVLVGSKLNLSIGGKEYDKKGFTKYELFLIKADKGLFNMEVPGKTPSFLQQFDPAKHIVKMKAAAPTEDFEPVEVEFSV